MHKIYVYFLAMIFALKIFQNVTIGGNWIKGTWDIFIAFLKAA